MVIVGRMGNETYLKYCVLSSNIFFLPNGRGIGNISGIYVLLMIKVSNKVMVEDYYLGWL